MLNLNPNHSKSNQAQKLRNRTNTPFFEPLLEGAFDDPVEPEILPKTNNRKKRQVEKSDITSKYHFKTLEERDGFEQEFPSRIKGNVRENPQTF